MTVKQSETESLNPEASNEVLDASLDALIAGSDAKAESQAQATPANENLDIVTDSGSPHPITGSGTPRPETPKTPQPSPSSGGGVGAHTLLGIGTLGLPLPPPRGGFPAFQKKPAADDPDSDATLRSPVQLPDPLTLQAAAHRDRALGRVPGLSAQPETPPPPSAPPTDSRRTPVAGVPVGPLMAFAGGSNDGAPVGEAGMGAVPAEVVDSGSGRAEVRSDDVEFEGPDDGPTSLNPEIGEALKDADFFSSAPAAEPARLPEPPHVLLPTGAPRLPSGQYPRLPSGQYPRLVGPGGEELAGDVTGFNLTLPPPARSRTTGSLPVVTGSSPSLPPMSLAALRGLAGLSSRTAKATLLRSRLTTAAAFLGCVLAGVFIDKLLLQPSHDKPAPAVTASAPPASASATPSPPAATAPPPAIGVPVATAPAPAPAPAPPAAPSPSAEPAPAAAPPAAVAQRPSAAASAAPSTPPAPPAAVATAPSSASRPPAAATPASPAAVQASPKAADDAQPPKTTHAVARRPTETGAEPGAARSPEPVAARSSPPRVSAPKPAALKPARPKTKWVDPFAP